MQWYCQNPFQDADHGMIAWFSKYQACQKFFVNHAQLTKPVQAVAARVNVMLPSEKTTTNDATQRYSEIDTNVSLVPYIRRLVVTGLDHPETLQIFFGEDWRDGVGSIHERERRNYLFAAKSDPWLKVKAQYDMGNGQTVPFLRPLNNVTEHEIVSAELAWSDWLAMQDWMLGPRAPEAD
ncbi:hypothetical protein E4U22_004870 [Claviceps purpurea]|nr:hypothetical protein E4U38_005740 [Claviceps purpurea]KAG6130305.1 hypothetical protein E4U12_004258 [Claviceps purpurea]KAG6138342.1 hypothetical protein E4U28_004254 [Claviceps purpurea]KAG6158922.1 hypothetical protein E4U11_004518 [Claviceps purpurea]KAG6176464.1 hypothetical protein E4U27_005173 [Claviceps purpurea]